MINAEALNLWDAVEKRVADGRFAQRALSALPLWLKAPLPSDWRFAKAEAASGVANDYSRNDWALVSAFIDLARIDRLRSLHLLEKLAQSGSMSAHAGIQMEAGPLLRSSVEGGNDDEKHLARSINSILVNNGRADMLSDLTVQIANAGSNDTDIPAI